MTPDQMDAFRELVNIGVGRAAGSLSQMCGARVDLRVPDLAIVQMDKLSELIKAEGGYAGDRIAAVRMPFSGAFRGTAELLFPAPSAAKLVALLCGERIRWSSMS